MENVSGTLIVRISDDGMEAFLASDRGTPYTISSAEILQTLLKDHGVVFGVLADELHSLASKSANNGKMVLARGQQPVEGKDGWVEYVFQQKAAPQNGSSDKRVDYRNLGWIHNVAKTDTVAIVHPPEPGVPGKTVQGKEIAPKAGKLADVKLGIGVRPDANDPCRVIAAEDGNAVIDANGVLQVQSSLVLDGNVDYATGDIDFVGSVIVKGDVKTNFKIKAGKSVEIHGNVEDATIEAGGEVLIRNGFIGQGKGSVKAGGNVKVQHILNQTIIAGEEIAVGREAICATLRAEERISAPAGVFVGCVLEAGSLVDVCNLGNGDQSQTKVRVGKRAMLLEQIAQVEKVQQKIQRQTEETKNALYALVRAQLDTGALKPPQQELQKKLKIVQTELGKSADALQKTKEELKGRLRENGLARIIVRDTISANVFVELNGVRKMVQGDIKEVVLTERSGLIEEKPFE
jgi:uncharacterized protein (DUF342 family)